MKDHMEHVLIMCVLILFELMLALDYTFGII